MHSYSPPGYSYLVPSEWPNVCSILLKSRPLRSTTSFGEQGAFELCRHYEEGGELRVSL